MLMKTRFLETKFHIPVWRENGVTRSRLLERLQKGLEKPHKFTLVCGPAGYGKTTLVSDWLYSLRNTECIAWLSLDKSDNDPLRFFSYWIGSFIHANESLGQRMNFPLDNLQATALHSLLDEIINNLSELDHSILMLLDDYHLITNAILHEALEYFLDHQPEQVHFVLVSREDPPFPLARMRARGQMTEIRAHDLRFSSQEASQFFKDSMKLDLPAQSVNDLEKRTEGWAVGLQLAGLAIQSLPNPQEFIESFRGSHRYVLDYLAEEVLRQLGKDIHDFLVRTSILDRLNASLCNKLTDRNDSQSVLIALEKSNLFINPLDDERQWYRYHHLFADYLQTELSKPELDELYKKAALWHEEYDLVYEAVKYALSCSDIDFVADVIERALKMDATWSGGNLTLLSSWLDALPPKLFNHRPWLNLNASRVLYLSGKFDIAEQRINETEQTLKSLPEIPDAERETILALAALNRGSIAAVRGDVKQAIEQATFAQSQLPQDNHLAHARAFFDLGLAYELSSQPELAIKNYLKSSVEAMQAGVRFLAIHANCAAAQVQISMGQLSLAEQTCRETIQIAAGERISPLGLAWIILGIITLERNDLSETDQLLQNGISLARVGGLIDDVVLGLVSLAHLRAYQGDSKNMDAIMQEAKSLMQTYGVERMSVLISAYHARMQLFLGNRLAATQWANEYQSKYQESLHEYIDLTLARILLATNQFNSLPDILHKNLEKAIAAQKKHTCIEVMLLLGLYHHSQNETQTALEWIEKSIQLAAPEGFVRLFLDEGKPLLDLLPRVRHTAPKFVNALIGNGNSENEPTSPLIAQLPDPLSEQEIRVLKLIVAGKSNQEIAGELVISVGTAKWHVHNVLQKLNVSNRPQAIARARELNID